MVKWIKKIMDALFNFFCFDLFKIYNRFVTLFLSKIFKLSNRFVLFCLSKINKKENSLLKKIFNHLTKFFKEFNKFLTNLFHQLNKFVKKFLKFFNFFQIPYYNDAVWLYHVCYIAYLCYLIANYKLIPSAEYTAEILQGLLFFFMMNSVIWEILGEYDKWFKLLIFTLCFGACSVLILEYHFELYNFIFPLKSQMIFYINCVIDMLKFMLKVIWDFYLKKK